MGVHRLPWTKGVKIWQFELTYDHLDTEDTKGIQRSLHLFVPKPYKWVPRDSPEAKESKFGILG